MDFLAVAGRADWFSEADWRAGDCANSKHDRINLTAVAVGNWNHALQEDLKWNRIDDEQIQRKHTCLSQSHLNL